MACRVTLIKWVANYMHVVQKKPEASLNSNNAHPLTTPQPLQQQNHEDSGEHEVALAHASLDSSKRKKALLFY